MALERVQTPSYGEISQAVKTSQNYLPIVAFNKPQWEKTLFERSNKWWLSSFIEQYGGELDPLAANEWNWAEKGKFYNKRTIASSVKNSDTNYTLTITGSETYFLERENVQFGITLPGAYSLNLQGRITSVNNAGANQVITVELIENGASLAGLGTADFDGTEVQVIYNSQAECFTIRDGRSFAPNKITNQLTKLNDSHKICDDSENQEIWFRSTQTGEMYWVDELFFENHAWHKMQVDQGIIHGQPNTFTDNTYDGVAGKGVLNFLETDSPIFQWSGDFLEADMQDMLTDLGIYSKYDTWQMIAGPEIYKQSLTALREYSVGGGVYFFDFGEGAQTVGLNYGEYVFGGKRLRLMEYKGFADPNWLTTGGVDYTKMAMLLNMEAGDIQLRYKKRKRGGKIREWINYQEGATIAANGAVIQTTEACAVATWTTHVGVQFKNALNHGLLVGE